MISFRTARLLLALTLFAPVLIARPEATVAQSILAGGIIEEIRIEGSLRVDPQTVRSYMRVNPGEPFDPILLDDSLKSIFASGLFADVTLRREGDVLYVVVVENPIVNRIAFEGNDALDDEELAPELELRPRQVFTRTKVQNDVQRLLDIYRRSGRFAAQVEAKIIELEQNRVDLVFEIEEGESTGIKSINFVGNVAFSDSDLRDEISTEESAWYRFLSAADTYDPDRLAFDRELLRRYYLSEGYADFQVESAVAELAEDRSGFIITFTVSEGERYAFGVIDVTTTLRDLDVEEVRGVVTTYEGEWYDATKVDDTIEELTEAVGNLGYAFVEVRPRARRDRENLVIDITYDIQEGPKVFVERIDIENNQRTLDRVVRREFRIAEGDAFNASKLARSRQRIENLGFFRSVNVTTEPGSTPDRTIVKVEVEEQSTGDITFGLGFSSASGPLGQIQISERNLLGKGQDVRLGLLVAGSQTEIDFSFTEPYFLEMPLAAGFDVFRVTREDDEADIDEEVIGFSLRMGYELTEHLRHIVRYTFEYRDIDDASIFDNPAQRADSGSAIRSVIQNTIDYDRRDNRFDPREGYNVTVGVDYIGVGGDIYAAAGTVDAGYYIPLSDQTTLAFKGQVGTIQGLGQDTRLSDRYFIGGRGFRGFARGLGPRFGDDAIGAKNFAVGTAELNFPLGLPEEYDIRGRLFLDFGTAFGFDGPKYWRRTGPNGILGDGDDTFTKADDASSLRVSAGPGFSWNSPFGPFSIDLGFALVKEDFDETEILSFSFGTQF